MDGLGWRSDRLVPPDDLVEDVGGAHRVRTPDMNDYWFGNFLQLDRPPQPGELAGWLERWERLMGEPRPQRVVLSWETPEPSLGDELRAEAARLSLEVEDDVVLRLDRLAEVPEPPGFTARPAAGDADWDAALAVAQADVTEHADFTARMQERYRERAQSGGGEWWVGEAGGEVVAGAGIFWDAAGRLARYQRVDTRADSRRRGYAAALLATMARDVAGRLPDLHDLVIVAESGKDGDRVYRRLGFVPASYSPALSRPVEALTKGPRTTTPSR